MKKLALLFLVFVMSFVTSEGMVLAESNTTNKSAPILETVEAYQARDGLKCNFFNGCVEAGTDVTIHVAGIAYNNGTPLPEGSKVKVRLNGSGGITCPGYPAAGFQEATLYNDYIELTVPGSNIKASCSYELVVKIEANESGLTGDEKPETNKTFLATSNASQAQCTNQCNEDLSMSARYELCSQIDESSPEYESCADCFSKDGIWTAIGCIPSNPESVIQTVITIGITLGGAVVLVMILAGAFMLSVSQGDPNKTKEAKEIITSAIIGLLFVIFSVTILQFIGVNILHIPGFGE